MPSTPFIAEIVMFGGNFAPRGWAFCEGQLLPIAQNTALFSILGTTYGGDGTTTFALPDLRGRFAMHEGQAPGLSNHPLGEKAGAHQYALTAADLPVHQHTFPISDETADQDDPDGRYLAQSDGAAYTNGVATGTLGSPTATTGNNNNTPISRMQPFLAINYIIALQGLFPST